MNQLVAGDISVSQATTFWNQTRQGAMHNIMRFEQDRSRYERMRRSVEAVTSTAPRYKPPRETETASGAAMAGDRVLSRQAPPSRRGSTTSTTWRCCETDR